MAWRPAEREWTLSGRSSSCERATCCARISRCSSRSAASLHFPVIQPDLADGRQPVPVVADKRQHVRRRVAVENRRVQAGAGLDERMAVSQLDDPLRFRQRFAHAQNGLYAAAPWREPVPHPGRRQRPPRKGGRGHRPVAGRMETQASTVPSSWHRSGSPPGRPRNRVRRWQSDVPARRWRRRAAAAWRKSRTRIDPARRRPPPIAQGQRCRSG